MQKTATWALRFINSATNSPVTIAVTPRIFRSCLPNATHGLVDRGFGTEKIEQEIERSISSGKKWLAWIWIPRSKKRDLKKIISDFGTGKVDILVGTQMVTKGLDFERVSLVGILNADNLLNFPDFRARTGFFNSWHRWAVGEPAAKQARNSWYSKHPVLNILSSVRCCGNDYAAMYGTQCTERLQFSYPPFFRLIEITLRHRDSSTQPRSKDLAITMRKFLAVGYSGQHPVVSRIQNWYIKQILLKIETTASAKEKAK